MTTWTLLAPLDISVLDVFHGDDGELLPFDSFDEALRVLDVVWDLLHILSYYNPITDDWDEEGLLDYLFNQVDWFDGSEGNDTVAGRGGDDVLRGGGGLDTAGFRGVRADYQLQHGSEAWIVSDSRAGRDDSDALAGFERLSFADRAVALDLDGHAGTVARLIGAVFGPEMLARADLVGLGLQWLDGGLGAEAVAAQAVASALFAERAGSHSNADFVRQVYLNVTGLAPSAADQAFYAGMLDDGSTTQGALALWASTTPENAPHIGLAGLAETGLDYLPPAG